MKASESFFFFLHFLLYYTDLTFESLNKESTKSYTVTFKSTFIDEHFGYLLTSVKLVIDY